MSQDLSLFAKDNGIRYFMISYTDLFGAQRAKLVPAAAIADMQRDGAGFRGFRHLARHDASPSRICSPCLTPPRWCNCPWKPRRGLGGGRLRHGGAEPVAQAPRVVLKRIVAARCGGQGRPLRQDRGRSRVLPDRCRWHRDLGSQGQRFQALLRPAGADAPLRRDRRDLRLHARARLGALPERPRGRERPVRDELEPSTIRAGHGGSPLLLQVHGQVGGRKARAAARPSCPSPSRA